MLLVTFTNDIFRLIATMHRAVMGRAGRRARAHLRQNTHCASTLGRRSFTAIGPVGSQAARAAEAVEQLTHKFEGKTSVRRQIFDANQLQKLSLTLGRRELGGVDVSDMPPSAGTPVPPGWHLVYFTPNGVESELGPDGTDRTFNSPAPFTRRMWAGGRMTWPAAGDETTALRVGDEVEERTRFVGATAKANKFGQEMVLVEIEKEFWGRRGLGVVDQRLVEPWSWKAFKADTACQVVDLSNRGASFFWKYQEID